MITVVLKLFEDVLPIPLHEVSSLHVECMPGSTILYLVVCAQVLFNDKKE